MKRFLYLGFVLVILSSCNRISSMKEHVVNYIKSSDLGLVIDPNNINSDQKLNYYYTGTSLYIVDNVKKRIIGLNNSNQIFFELGNPSKKKVNEGPNWENEIYDLMTELQERNQVKMSQNAVLDINVDEPKNSHKPAQEIIKGKYQFETIGNIAVDHRNNIYVEHIYRRDKKNGDPIPIKPVEKDMTLSSEMSIDDLSNRLPENNSIINALLAQNLKNQKNALEVEILKFSSQGKFLYRIGEEGRDNPNFKGNITILNFFFNKDNDTMWLRYLKDEQIFIRLYTGYGKNILLIEESKIAAAIKPHLNDMDNAKYKYKIEDIYPVPSKRKAMVVVDIFSVEDLYKVVSKQIFILNSDYVVEDTRKVRNNDSQIYGVTNESNSYFLSYKPKDSSHTIELFDPKGSMIQRKNIDFQFGYYKRLGIDITGQGELIGLFLRKDDFLFVLWK